jgi:TonB family protein
MMNRLQKKCLIATAGLHLLLVLTVVFGAGFMGLFKKERKPEETHILTAIPANLIDKAMESGVAGAQPPPPAPPQPPQPKPEPPQPGPEPPQPKPEPPQPKPTLTETIKDFFKPEPPKPQPDDLKADEPEPKPTKPESKKIKVSLDPVVRKTTKTTKTTDTSEADAQREAQREADRRARAFRSTLRSISDNASTATSVDMPGASSTAYANYDQAVLSIYNSAWTSPEGMSSGEAAVKVRVVIRRDGSVVSARIIDPSGNAKMDKSVQQALDRVSEVRPFPSDFKEQQRTIEFTFRARSKPLLG